MKSLKELLPSRPAVIAIVLIALAAIACGVYGYTARHSQKTAAAATTKQVVPPSAVLLAPKPALTPMPVDRSICIVHKGEGIEHALIRQLMADPSVAGFQGKTDDTSTLKQWADHEAHVLALKAGYIGKKFGEEIRVQSPETMAYVIEKDPVNGNLQIVEYSTVRGIPSPATPTSPDNEAPGFRQLASHGVTTTIAAAHFIGPQDGTTVLPNPYRTYEYMYVG